MATAPKESSSTHQRGGGIGGGGGGKIRKTVYRNTQATPYDRPLTAFRNSNNSVSNTNGWLSRLVDPASKITSGARRILSSVFSNRILPSAAPKPPASDLLLQKTEKHQGTSTMGRAMAEQNAEDVACGQRTFDTSEVDELEQMLKDKSFTRYETDRLTTLLRSRTVSGSVRGEEGIPSITIANEQAFKHHAYAYTPQRDPFIPFYRQNGYTPTSSTRNKVFEEDISSPLEIAKAYMDSRASKFSPPFSDSRALARNSWTPNMQHFVSKKGSELRRLADNEPSSSAYELSNGQRRVSGFKNASLKRRCSVLQDQYGSIGSIRRVRQKLNLINSKALDSSACECSPPISRSTDKTIALADIPTSSVDPAPVNFIEVAQQTAPVLNQSIYLENKAISNEISGSSAAISPPLPASETLVSKKIRNLEKGESSGVIKDARLDNSMDDSRDTLGDAGYSATKDSMASKNEATKINSYSTDKISDTKLLKLTPLAEATFCDGNNSGVGPLQKKHAFRMSVLEDFVDMDEDDSEGALSHNISVTTNEERHPMMLSGGVPLPVGSTDVNEVPSAVLPSGSPRVGGVMGLKIYDEPVISEKCVSFRDSVDASSLSSRSAMPIGASSLMFNSSPVVANASSEPKPQASPDPKLEAYRFGSNPADVDRTSKQSEDEKLRASPETRHLFSKPQADPVAAAPALENSSGFSFGNAANNKGSPFNSSSGSSLQSAGLYSNFIGDNKQTNLPATNLTVVGSNNGQTSSASDYGGESTNIKQSTYGSEMAPSTPSSAPIAASSGTANNTAASLNSIMTPAQFHTPGTGTEMHFSSLSAASTSSLSGSLSPTVKSSDGASLSAPVVASFAASSINANGIGSTFGVTATPGQTTAVTTNTGFATGASTSPITFGVASTSTPTTSATTNTGFVFGGSLTPATVTSSSGISFGTSSVAGGGFSVGASSTPTITSSVFPFSGSSTPAAATSGFSVGALSTPTTTSSVFPFDASSTPATTTSSVFPFNASSTPATTTSGFPVGASSTPTTSSSVFPFGALTTQVTTTNGFSVGVSSTPTTTSSVFPFGASSTLATTTNGFSVGASSTPTTTSSVFPFGASSTPATTTNGFSVGASATPTTNSSVFPIGASSIPATTSVFSIGTSSTPTTTSSVFPFGSSSTKAAASGGFSFGISSTPATTMSGFSFGGSSTPATTSSGFSLGGWSTPAVAITSTGISSTMSPSPAAKTTISGFSFGAQPTAGTTAAGATSSAFDFGPSATSTRVTSTAGFHSGSSSTFGVSSTPNPFSFGAASTATAPTTNNGSPFGFMAGNSSFPFNSGTASAAQPIFGNSNPFGSNSAVNNNNQTNMEDSMAEDSVQACPPAFPAFGSQQTANTSGFGFSAPNPNPLGTSNSFQFASQPNLSNPSPFQSSGSLGVLSAGGSFSLGSAGEKSNRRIIKPKKGVRRK